MPLGPTHARPARGERGRISRRKAGRRDPVSCADADVFADERVREHACELRIAVVCTQLYRGRTVRVIVPGVADGAMGEQRAGRHLLQPERIGRERRRAREPAQTGLRVSRFHQRGAVRLRRLRVIGRDARRARVARQGVEQTPLQPERGAEQAVRVREIRRHRDDVAAHRFRFHEAADVHRHRSEG